MSLGRVVHGASCLWGEITAGQNIMGRVSIGLVVPGASFDVGQLSGILQIDEHTYKYSGHMGTPTIQIDEHTYIYPGQVDTFTIPFPFIVEY
jgi:hypothetical protein